MKKFRFIFYLILSLIAINTTGCGGSKKIRKTEKTISGNPPAEQSAEIKTHNPNNKGEVPKKENPVPPYGFMNEPPLFPDCDINLSTREKRKCLNQHFAEIFKKNFNLTLAKNVGSPGENIVINIFLLVDPTGHVHVKKIMTRYPELEMETRRVITLVPRLRPGYKNGKPVSVLISVPIIFKIEEDLKQK